MNTATCDKCGQEYGIGEWPLCPHGVPMGHMTFRPYVDEMVGPEPVEVRSLAEKWRLMKANKADYAPKQVGMPGCMV